MTQVKFHFNPSEKCGRRSFHKLVQGNVDTPTPVLAARGGLTRRVPLYWPRTYNCLCPKCLIFSIVFLSLRSHHINTNRARTCKDLSKYTSTVNTHFDNNHADKITLTVACYMILLNHTFNQVEAIPLIFCTCNTCTCFQCLTKTWPVNSNKELIIL